MIEYRSCQCEDRPCCGCDNGAFEVEEEELFSEGPTEGNFFPREESEDGWLDAAYEDRFDLGD